MRSYEHEELHHSRFVKPCDESKTPITWGVGVLHLYMGVNLPSPLGAKKEEKVLIEASIYSFKFFFLLNNNNEKKNTLLSNCNDEMFSSSFPFIHASEVQCTVSFEKAAAPCHFNDCSSGGHKSSFLLS